MSIARFMINSQENPQVFSLWVVHGMVVEVMLCYDYTVVEDIRFIPYTSQR